ncbi:hypothetical protein CH1034_400023 [Klebsiella pneumoniae]|nr:hypothetical protein CH1034_400023 [Klebsiella pneumoniae]
MIASLYSFKSTPKQPKKSFYFSRAKIYLKRQSRSAKGVRDLIPPTPSNDIYYHHRAMQ